MGVVVGVLIVFPASFYSNFKLRSPTHSFQFGFSFDLNPTMPCFVKDSFVVGFRTEDAMDSRNVEFSISQKAH